jgi:cobyrinic acid a,c-diamide synthase
VDLDALLSVFDATPLVFEPPPAPLPPAGGRVRIAIARDAAFGFYYPDDLEALEQAGAELVTINTLEDADLPDVDGLFIGGGFPEVHMEALEANVSLRAQIREAIDRGLPVYAECGGLMYLSRSIAWKDRKHMMVGAIPADTVMHDRPVGRGYIALRENANHPWPATAGIDVRGHEFHYSGLENVAPGLQYAYEVVRGFGVDGKRDGIVYRNVLACYGHLRDLDGNHWASRFVEFVRRTRRTGTRPAATA